MAYAGKNFGGFKVGGSASYGVRPQDAGEFSKICKRFLKKIDINVVFSPILQENFKTMRKIFAGLDEKHNCLGKILRKF